MYKITLILLGALIGLSYGGLLTRNKCVEVPSNVCAVVFDDEKCNGWKLNIDQGEVEIVSEFYWHLSHCFRLCSNGGTPFTTGTGMTLSQCLSDKDVPSQGLMTVASMVAASPSEPATVIG